MSSRDTYIRQTTIIVLFFITSILVGASLSAVVDEDPDLDYVYTLVVDPDDEEPDGNETGGNETGQNETGGEEPDGNETGGEEPNNDTSPWKSNRKNSIPPNKPPIAIHNGPYTGIVNEPIQLDGSKSYDPDGDEIIKYEWNLGNGDILTGKTISYTYENPYNYYVTLTVYDNHHASNSAYTTANIIQPNRAPEIPIISGINILFTDIGYSFAAQSDDKDNDDIQYTFNWDDGTQTSSDSLALPGGKVFSTIHSWDEPGTYTIEVTVSDGELTSSATFDIQVTQPSLVTNIAIVLLAIILLALFIIMFFYRRK